MHPRTNSNPKGLVGFGLSAKDSALYILCARPCWFEQGSPRNAWIGPPCKEHRWSCQKDVSDGPNPNSGINPKQYWSCFQVASEVEKAKRRKRTCREKVLLRRRRDFSCPNVKSKDAIRVEGKKTLEKKPGRPAAHNFLDSVQISP